jgi:hypothetical protein
MEAETFIGESDDGMSGIGGTDEGGSSGSVSA